MADVKVLLFEFSTPKERQVCESTLAKWLEDGYRIAGTNTVEYPMNHILVVILVKDAPAEAPLVATEQHSVSTTASARHRRPPES